MVTTELKAIISFLKEVSFFSEISETSLIQFCKDLHTEIFNKNELIFKKGDVGDAMYVIFSGTVKVHDGSHIYNHLSVGDCFGEYALIDNLSRSASVTATEVTTVLKIEGERFQDLMIHDSGFSTGVLSVLIKRHRELDIAQEQLGRSKEAMALANSKLTGLIDGAMDAIIMFDSNFRIVLTNPSANKLLENDEVMQRNVLFFFDEASANLIENLVKSGLSGDKKSIHNYLPEIIKVIGSNETETLNEGTISTYGNDQETFFTLILRNIEERLIAEDQINLLTKKAEYLEEEIKELTDCYGIIAKDKIMLEVLKLIDQVAKTDTTVLITGETGTGKELVAKAIHDSSLRKDKPLIRINCGAIPTNLIESELFGHEKGAFTGAITSRKGRFLLADKGTIFLDEIGELPLELQPKLLRVIQEGEFDPVGSSQTIKVDVRIIAATHRNLLECSKEGKFREDLYYRLNVFPIDVPPLRDRGDDVGLIAQELITRFSKKLNKPVGLLTDSEKAILSAYDWPGNVRELQNLIERAIIISQNGAINWHSIIPNQSVSEKKAQPQQDTILTPPQLNELEKENILKALKLTRWKISGKDGAAELLKLPPTTLASRIKALGIERPI
jgi:PAS domain S-box-containing protein